jgi:hypothetical protein
MEFAAIIGKRGHDGNYGTIAARPVRYLHGFDQETLNRSVIEILDSADDCRGVLQCKSNIVSILTGSNGNRRSLADETVVCHSQPIPATGKSGEHETAVFAGAHNYRGSGISFELHSRVKQRLYIRRAAIDHDSRNARFGNCSGLQQ